MSKKIVQLNEEIIKNELKELVRNSVEETLNEMYLAGISVRRVEWGRYYGGFTGGNIHIKYRYA
jgi:hypothetical protein